MKKVFSVRHMPVNIDMILLIARVVIAGLMLTHGLPKFFSLFSGEPVQFPSIFGMSPAMSLSLAVFAEVICSLLVLLGLGTRLAVIPLIITMLVAVFQIHSADEFTRKEPGIQFLLVYVLLLIGGSGKYSLDALIDRKLNYSKF